MAKNIINVGSHAHLIPFTAKGNQLGIPSTFKINVLYFFHTWEKKKSPTFLKNDNQTAVGSCEAKFNPDPRSRTGSGEAPCEWLVTSACPAGGGRLAYSPSTHLWSSFPVSFPSIWDRGGSLEREESQGLVVLFHRKTTNWMSPSEHTHGYYIHTLS